MLIGVHFTMKGVPGSIKTDLEVESMDDDVINTALHNQINEHLTHANIHMNKVVTTIFLIYEK